MPGVIGGVGRFAEAKSKLTALLQADLRAGSVVLRGLAHEKTRSLNGQIVPADMHGFQHQTEVAAIGLQIRRAGRLHTTDDRSSARDQRVASDYNRFVQARHERIEHARFSGRDCIVQTNHEQRACGKVLGIVKGEMVLAALRAITRRVVVCQRGGGRSRVIVKWSLAGLSAIPFGRDANRSRAARSTEQDHRYRGNQKSFQSTEPAHPNHLRAALLRKGSGKTNTRCDLIESTTCDRSCESPV